MRQSHAIIINYNSNARGVTASAARISTQSGTAMEIFARSGDSEKDLKLIRKVLSSGHQSVIEHQTVSIAFNDVSVLAEQFIIEFRLASFTVKSRRYVDFSNAGFMIPESLTDAQAKVYRSCAEARFQDYARLLEMGIPKEDARFLFPYCLRSNFFVTLNARELMRMIRSMLCGRGARFEELRQLGEQLRKQFDEMYPDVLEFGDTQAEAFADIPSPDAFRADKEVRGSAALIGQPAGAEELLGTALKFSGRWTDGDQSISSLIKDSRPRELEMLNYTFRISDVSLACVTHFTRHRMQSLVIPDVFTALAGGKYVLPDSVRANPEAMALYRCAFEAQADAATELMRLGASREILSYLALSGHVMDLLLTMNARELLLFARLRTCARAQWEIRAVARQMVAALNEAAPSIFGGYGPSCAIFGKCPEGKMTCGHPVTIENGLWTMHN